ncbi:bifunctional tetrahydrofolate synthase/dihydrofolate synthase [Methylobacillus caricis]|uniref:bifunctional tetrahydrofolate synthase/dihydrofolate synthase n=1 Tax=Methylobacillus caricis TaxID=1971611 RepID=UPI001D000A8F|nr:bifunctional tetrahydrofolate synthase/dihydrofolate synthase [Methylobacillus caricis]MCB5187228.1 bifunctional tetrahydrofolate synthase/dihydrofolate synthase [Methylobacillus caricis]
MTPSLPIPADLAGWLAYIEALHPASIEMGLERVDLVRKHLNLDPAFPVIIVAGTNGKGSTCAMLERVYHAAGYRVGCYTSPHFVRYSERVRVGCQEIADADLIKAFDAVEAARRDTSLTYFEFGTLAAVWHFTQAAVDVAILEVGLGGRLDAVNVFTPACTIVTSIDLDHMDFLGNDRECIGREKAGVFRTGIAAICGDEHPPQSLKTYAKQIGADLRCIGQDFAPSHLEDGWEYRVGAASLSLPLPALAGDFQLNNAACVINALHAMQSTLPVNIAHIRQGLQEVTLNGRFQSCRTNPQVILDVAHNPHAAVALAENLQQRPIAGRTIAVFSMLADKDIAGVVSVMAPHIDAWYVASVGHLRGATQAQLLAFIAAATKENAQACGYENVISAYRQACIDAGENDRIIVFGSFFTVADVMGELAVIHSD